MFFLLFLFQRIRSVMVAFHLSFRTWHSSVDTLHKEPMDAVFQRAAGALFLPASLHPHAKGVFRKLSSFLSDQAHAVVRLAQQVEH